MSKTIRCPCGAQLRLGQNAQATTIRCPKCQRQLRLKAQAPETAAAPPGSSAGQSAPPHGSAPAAKAAMIDLRCDCGTRLRAPRSAIGKTVRCPKCQQRIPVRPEPPRAAAPAAAPVAWVTATPVDEGFDFDLPTAAAPPPPAAPMAGFSMPSFGASASQPAYWTQLSRARNVSLKAGSPPTHVIRGGAIALLVIISLTVFCQIGLGVTGKLSRAHAEELRSNRPSSAAEARTMMEDARVLRDRYVTTAKIFMYGYCLLRVPALVAVLACGVGLVMAIFQVRGGILVVLVVTCAVGVGLIGLDGAMRSIPMMTLGALDQESRLFNREPRSVPADMWLMSTFSAFGNISGTVWTAGAIEALWGAFLAGIGVFSAMWRHNQNRGGLTMPVLLSVFGSLYSLGMLVLANALASLHILDDRDIHFMMYVILAMLFWTVTLFAVLVSHGDATAQRT